MRYTGRKGWQFKRSDVFDLGHTLNPIIKAGLEKFLAEKDHPMFGIPGAVIADLSPENTWGTDNDEQHEIAYATWISYLEQMIFAFSEHDWELEYNEEHNEKLRAGRELFGKYYASLWW